MQRKQRFESLRKIQNLMETTEIEKPVGTDFLEEIYRKNEEEVRIKAELKKKKSD